MAVKNIIENPGLPGVIHNEWASLLLREKRLRQIVQPMFELGAQMKTTVIAFALTAAGVALSGCANQTDKWALAGYGVSAEPLYDYHAGVPADWGTGRPAAWKAVMVSEQKCTQFVNGLVATETGTNTSLDILTTITSGLATAFTPVATSHALSAASTISSGARTAIDSDVFAKASIANFAQAIQSTYFKDIGNYGTKLQAKSDPIDINAELPQIQSIHAECALGSAEASISSTLQGSSPAAAPGAAPPAGAATTSFVTPGHAVQ